MKSMKKLALIGLVAIIALFGFTTCDGDGGGGGGGGGGGSGGGGKTDADSFVLGETSPGGGKIFYHSAGGFTMTDNSQLCHYLEVAPSNQGYLYWWNGTYTDIVGTGTAIGTGRKNTVLIPNTEIAPAAKACNDYSNNGKSDWFLPSRDELNQLYVNRTHVGNLSIGYYLSSSQDESQSNRVWYQNFSNGSQDIFVKGSMGFVCPIRAF